MRTKICFTLAALVAAVILVPAPASAGFIVSVSGGGVLVAPPADASPGAFQADNISVWEESTGTIVSDLALDHDGTPGAYAGNDDFSGLGTVLTEGTKYNSSFVHLDLIDRGISSAKAVVEFTGKIIGIALFGSAVDASDIYGAPGTTYPTGAVPTVGLDTRGIDFRANDTFSISPDGKTLTLHLTGKGLGFDQIRVFTAAGVPEPASLAVWALIGSATGAGSWWRKRRSAR